jgi:hypothetical protein
VFAANAAEAQALIGGPVAERAHERGILTVATVAADEARELLRLAEAEMQRRGL